MRHSTNRAWPEAPPARRCPDLLRPSDAVAPARKIPRGFTTQIGARIAVTEVVGDDKDNVRLPAACRLPVSRPGSAPARPVLDRSLQSHLRLCWRQAAITIAHLPKPHSRARSSEFIIERIETVIRAWRLPMVISRKFQGDETNGLHP
jgi:hypothetical protein